MKWARVVEGGGAGNEGELYRRKFAYKLKTHFSGGVNPKLAN